MPLGSNHSVFIKGYVSPFSMAAEIIDGQAIARAIRKEVAEDVKDFVSTYHVTPKITTLLIGATSESQLYLRLRDKACKEVGIDSSHLEFKDSSSQETVIKCLHDLNNDPEIHGILIQFPLPHHLSQQQLLSNLSPEKDVEGLTPKNMGETLIGEEYLVPCTPLAVLKILSHMHVSLQGKNVVIVNHSTVVGKPLTALLLNRNATVSVCHVYTEDLPQYTRMADILVTGAGVPGLITGKHVKPSAAVIDVGITPTAQGVRGDVDVESVKEQASWLTPVPGGVGPVTVACSLLNMMKTARTCSERGVL
jgi:methylenetetrahydrofolate dehydrogenase (NADP+)/methenyltetrahydrofolate cyclohydrolase